MSMPLQKPTPEELAFSRLLCFSKYIYPDFVHPPHIRLLARKLEEVEREGGKRIIISIPPRHGKSFLASQIFPAWYLGRNPKRFIITLSYGDELATDFGRAVRNYVGDPAYEEVFPGISLARDSRSSSRFNTAHGGSYFAVGVGGAITGRGAHLLLVDDTVKNWEEAQSKTNRKKIIEWFLSTAYTRLQKNGSVIIINTRWHDEDLPGYLMKHDKGNLWEEICIPALGENDEPISTEFFSQAELVSIRATLGARIFSCLYQGKPIPEEGGIIKGAWFRRYKVLPDGKPIRIIQSWDTAVKDQELNDYSVCTTWHEHQFGKYYLVDVLRGRWAYPDLKRTARNHIKHHRPDVVLIEDKGSGSVLIQELELETDCSILAINPTESKQTRFIKASPKIEVGRVYLPEDAPWLAEYESELVGYPAMEYDDQVDSTSQALNYAGQIFYSGVDWDSTVVGFVRPEHHWDFYASVFWRHDLKFCVLLYFGVSEDRMVRVMAEEMIHGVLPREVAKRILKEEGALPGATLDGTAKRFDFVLGNPDLWAKKGVADSSA
ncbi:MAG: phage terminase large subunit, partial [Gammaproteobacteria bacterium]|nr:phage terminase large subunit [Gammaproteobacteria bacterium]